MYSYHTRAFGANEVDQIDPWLDSFEDPEIPRSQKYADVVSYGVLGPKLVITVRSFVMADATPRLREDHQAARRN